MYAKFLKRKINYLAFALVAFLPLGAYASVSFTELMYDHPGADTGHEWVEIQNTGAEQLDLKNFKFFEGGVNHKLVSQNSSQLSPNAYAIIANDAKQFSFDYPTFSGPLFQSSFSLSNTGETLALKDASGAEVASFTYSSGDGAKGNGNTLNAVNASWVPRSPTPGASAAPSALVPPAPAAPTKPSVSGNSTAKTKVSALSASSAAKAFGSKAPLVAAAVEASTGTAILPWVVALGTTIAAGVIAVIYMRTGKKPEDEYEIIEDKS